jgi:acetyltransferase-like isoleucine patch superfamily enzyme
MKMFIKNIAKFFYYLFKSEIVLSKIFRSSHNSIIDKNSKVYSPSLIINSKIGFGSYIAQFSIVNSTEIGKFCSIGPNFLSGYGIHPTNGISTSPMFYSTKNQAGKSFTTKDKIEETKPIFIGNDVFIGANVIVLDGVTINDGAIIGAGAVVVNDIPPYAIAVGVPARIVKYRFSSDEIDSFLKIKWWDWPEDKLKDIEKYFFDIKIFLDKNDFSQ